MLYKLKFINVELRDHLYTTKMIKQMEQTVQFVRRQKYQNKIYKIKTSILKIASKGICTGEQQTNKLDGMVFLNFYIMLASDGKLQYRKKCL
jgi:hypothetical protein